MEGEKPGGNGWGDWGDEYQKLARHKVGGCVKTKLTILLPFRFSEENFIAHSSFRIWMAAKKKPYLQ